jgi:Tol biopolymer transport system component
MRRLLVLTVVVGLLAFGLARFVSGRRERTERPAEPPAVPTVAEHSEVVLPHELIAYAVEGEEGLAPLFVADAADRTRRKLVEDMVADAPFVWSPDERWIAYVAGGEDRESLYAVRVDDGDRTRVSGEYDLGEGSLGYLYLVEWSPDSRWLAFAVARDGEPGDPRADIYMARPGGDEPWRVASGIGLYMHREEPIRTVAWSQDGRWLGLCDGESLLLTSSEDEEATTVEVPGGGIFTFLWSPDSAKVAMFAPDADYETAVHVYDLASTTQRVIATRLGPGLAEWAPASQGLLISEEPVDGFTRLRAWLPGSEGAILVSGDHMISDYTWLGRSSRLAVVAQEDGRSKLCAVDINGAGWQGLSDLSDVLWSVPSPGGSQVLYAVRDAQSEAEGLYAVAAEGGDAELVLDRLPNVRPTWRADGHAALVEVFDDERQVSDALVLEWTESGVNTVALNGSVDVFRASWSPLHAFVSLLSLPDYETGGVLGVVAPGEEMWLVAEDVRWGKWPPGAADGASDGAAPVGMSLGDWR